MATSATKRLSSKKESTQARWNQASQSEIPTFDGKSDANVYIEWETKIEKICSCNNFPKEQKVQLAALEFSGYALVW